MKLFKINALLLTATLAFVAISCEDGAETDSVVSRFPTVIATLGSPTVAVQEFEAGTYNYTFTLDDNQITDLVVHVSAGPSSTATEGEDFDFSIHDVEISALAGQDGFSFDVIVHDDFQPDEEDEQIYVTFSTATPSGVSTEEFLLGTIVACPAPVNLFEGDYMVTSTAGFFGVPIFNDQVVELSADGGSTRSFEAVYYEVFGIGNDAERFELKFDGCHETVSIVRSATSLGCSASFSIELMSAEPAGTFDISDDGGFTVVLTEIEEDPAAVDACGMDGSVPVTLTFTRL